MDLDFDFIPPDDPASLLPDANSPHGYTIDRVTGERRAKKKAGRPSVSSTPEPAEIPEVIEELKDREPDVAPASNKRKGKLSIPKGTKPAVEVPPFRAGPIAKGMNKMYFKVGKLVRVMDPEVGQAIMDITIKESEDDVTVGEAWEEIAKVNPRVRAVLLKMITGNAWRQVFMAHAPILLAIVMKPAIINRLPMQNLIQAYVSPDEHTPEGGVGGLTQADMGQVGDLLASQMKGFGIELTPEMMKMAAGMMGHSATPPRQG